MKQKIKVPAQWYKETRQYYAETIIQIKSMPAMQRNRILACIKYGKDHEEMQMGTETVKIPIEKLFSYYEDALKQNPKKYEALLKQMPVKYEPTKMKSKLSEAKAEAAARKKKNPNFFDNDYVFHSKMCEKYFLTEKESEKLLSFMADIEIID